MLSIVGKKIIELMPTILGITLSAFLLVRLTPGDPVLLMVGERGADHAQYAAMKERLGLDKPLYAQYGHFIAESLRGDLGTSTRSHQPVTDEFLARWPATIELGVVALFLSMIIGIPLGIVAALKKNSTLDYLLTGGSLVGYSMPIFWWGLVLILVFSVHLDWTPVSGRIDVAYYLEPRTGFLLLDSLAPDVIAEYGYRAFGSVVAHLILPAVAMATIPLAVFARMTRASMIEVLREDYIRTARAIGLSRFKVVFVHAFRNALIPVVTTGGLLFISTVLTGAILTETIFSWPGIGSYIVAGINARDYPVIQGAVLLIGLIIVAVNLLVELAYMWADPRVRD